MNHNKKILIIDDEPFNRKLIKLQLKNLFFDFHEAENHSIAFNILNSEKIDLIFCDIKLNELNGIEILKEVKDKFSDIPVIMLSCYDEEGCIKEAKSLGCFDYIIKPVKKQQLIKIANNALSK